MTRLRGRAAREGWGGREGTAGDRGSISLLMVLIGVAFVGALIAGLGIGGVKVARHRAQNAADAGALAGAVWAVDGPSVACAVAGRAVTANDATLVSCAVDGFDVRVTVDVRLGDGMAAKANARAGPVWATDPVGATDPPWADGTDADAADG